MKSIKKHSILFVLTVMMMCFATGCGVNFDASGYIKACLDANAHGEFAAYAEITQSSEEEVAQMYNDMLDQEISYLDAYNISDEKKENFRQLFVELYKNFKYEVGEAVKNDDDTFSVPVTTYKLMVFKDIMDEGETYMTDYVQQEIDAGRTPTEDDIYGIAVDFMYDSISRNLEALEYAEPVTTNVTVGPTGSDTKVYSISQNELQSLLESMVDIENAQ
ncbi:MAG: hypothetical protein NC124_11810 [Clostridium sp.]|nr:hypothetical protein [Clostridium sp.]